MWFCWCPRVCVAVQPQPVESTQPLLPALGVKVRLGVILSPPRGRGVGVRASLCVGTEGSSFFI